METPAPEPIGKVMAPALATLDFDATLADAIELMQREQVHHVMVTRSGRLEGLLSERDVLQWAPQGRGLTVPAALTSHVHLLMARKPISVGPLTPLDEALGLMVDRKLQALPIVDGKGRPLGIVTLHDIGHGLLDHDFAAA